MKLLNGKNHWEEKQFIVHEHEVDLRIDVVLQKRFSRFSRNQWQKRIESGLVKINGHTVRPARSLNFNDVITYKFIEKDEPQVASRFSIVYENSDFMLIDKPSNLPVHPAGIYNKNTLLGLLRKKKGPSFMGHFVQRLDRESSGLLLVAKNSQAANELIKALRSQESKKEYLVWVEGVFPLSLQADGYIGQTGKGPVRKKMHYNESPFIHAKDAKTQFQRVKVVMDKIGSMSLLRARIITGRTHQIRATLCSLGFPVVGDRLYGFDETTFLRFINDTETFEDKKRLRILRSALHSHRLSFLFRAHRYTFTSPLPRELTFPQAKII